VGVKPLSHCLYMKLKKKTPPPPPPLSNRRGPLATQHIPNMKGIKAIFLMLFFLTPSMAAS